MEIDYSVDFDYFTTYTAGEGPYGLADYAITDIDHFEQYGFTINLGASSGLTFYFGGDTLDYMTDSVY